ncbi:thermopsin [Acidianus sp. HS-5]|nr:thermopsin [Acidianus sp. HS-5]
MGTVNITALNIGDSYFSSGGFFTRGNASLQLNVMIDGNYWAQDVALFHEINCKKFEITMIINLWNLSGPFKTLKTNVTTYQGIGVYLYQGPTFNITLPSNFSLFMKISNNLEFGYCIDGKKYIYQILPYFGSFQIGSLSILGLPNDLEFVWGGPGCGSEVCIYGEMNEEIYYLQQGKLIIPCSAFSIGLDTAESAYGLKVLGNFENISNPFACVTKGVNSPSVLWPIPPKIVVQSNGSIKHVKLCINGFSLSDQKIEVLVPSTNLSSPIPFTSVKDLGYTNDNGEITFNISCKDLYIIYYVGNYSLSSAYYISSPLLAHIVSSIKSAYNSLVSFLKGYNFKHALSSSFSKIKYKSSSVSVNYLLLEYIGAFAVGILVSAILAKYKF